MKSTIYYPATSYRLQFNKDFTFADAIKIIPYLEKTGIKTIYASPVFQAVTGSMHGYDITNPLHLNPELGTEEEFNELVELLHRRSMGWIQDIVPNHMAFSPENPWIDDVLEKGNDSDYIRFFDIISENRNGLDSGEKLMLPFFGKTLDKLIEDHELSVCYTDKGFKIRYYEQEYPVSVNAYEYLLVPSKKLDVPLVIGYFLSEAKTSGKWDKNKKMFFSQVARYPEILNYINKCLSVFNSDPQQMKKLIDQLSYRPAFWKETENMINYRRFFTINNMICLNIQDEKVFTRYHKLIKTWSEGNRIDGVRVDHIDGLFNPTEYLERLRKLCGSRMYILVEKILEKDENLPEDWPIEGTTGYDFLGTVNNLLTNPDTGYIFHNYYNDWIEKTEEYRHVFYKKNRFILYSRFQGELNNLTRECLSIPSIAKHGLSGRSIRNGLAEFLIFCPVYKIYHAPSVFTESDKLQVNAIFDSALNENKNDQDALKALRDIFSPGKRDRKEILRIDTFFRHCMQFTGPLMAKGIEDTAFYSYNPFIGHNEVGDSPAYFGIRTENFHRMMVDRQENTPLTMNSTSTHDTKRGEDARARLNVLSNIPEKWMIATKIWRKINKKYKYFEGAGEIPTANDEYFIYQVLCAHLPMDGKIDDSFLNRLQDYLRKALREAKVNSSWSNPDENYETKTLKFTQNILSAESDFVDNFLAFMREIIPHGIINSITQMILKNFCPGVPDTYQGCERWNLSFVDPDNRQAVNFRKLSDDLDKMILDDQLNAIELAGKLLKEAETGKLKQWITYKTLQQRKRNETFYQKGNYIPLSVEGNYKEYLIAFYRCYMNEYLLVVLPLNTASLPLEFEWQDLFVGLPESVPHVWENQLTGITIRTAGKLFMRDIFAHLPFGILKAYFHD